MGAEQFGPRGNVWANAREMGIWKDVPFLATNFKGLNTMTMTVTPASVIVNRYCRVGNLVHWNIWLASVVLGGTATNQINLTPPTPNQIARYHSPQFGLVDDGVLQVCIVVANPQGVSNPATIGVSPLPTRSFTLGSTVQVKLYISYEYGKSNLIP